MSQYSEMIGSFVRTSNYPLEANYIFETETELIKFFDDPINRTLLHEGLFKIVLNDGDLALYWVVKNKDGYLYFEKLIDYKTISSLDDLIEKLNKEIQDRILADLAIWGTKDTTEIDLTLNSILKISEVILDLKKLLEDIKEEEGTLKSELKATVGTEEDNIIEYLKTLDYESLTKVSETLHYFLDSVDEEKDSIDTWPELQAFLEGFNLNNTLLQILTDLWHNIEGYPLPNTNFRTLRGIQDFVEELKSYSINRMNNIQTELDLTLVGVGLSGDGAYNADKETYYLKEATSVMNALKILDSLINEAINNCNLTVKDTNTIDLQLDKYSTETILLANVKISTESGNGIIPKTDGIYYKLSSTYEDGILKLLVNDSIVSSHTIGLSTIVKNAYYDPDTEALVFEFELHDGKTLILNIPVSTLIREWDVDNSNSSKVVELTREEVVGNGADKLSADVRLFVDKYNILVKQGNALYVKGTTDNLVHHDLNLEVYLDLFENSVNEIAFDLNEEINRAKEAEKEIQTNLDNEILRSTDKDTLFDGLLNTITNNLASEINRATTKETELESLINSESERAKTSESKLTKDLSDEINRAKLAELELSGRITNETSRATSEEKRISKLLDNTISNLANEVLRATNKESDLNNKIDAEITRAIDKENEISLNLLTEVDRASKAEGTLLSSITLVDHRVDDVTKYLNDEIKRSTDKDKELEDRINGIASDYSLNVTDSSTIDLEVDNTSGTNLTASVKLSEKDGNILQPLDNGIYAHVDVDYDATTNKIIFTDGSAVKELQLSVGSIIDRIEYDPATENLILYYTNSNNQLLSTSVNVSNLIKEWDVNNDLNSVIVLTKSPHIIDGVDTLSAELKISNKENQGLQNIDGYLFVSNNAKDIVYKDSNVSTALDSLNSGISEIDSKFDSFKTEIKSDLNNLETKVESKLEVFGNKYDTAIQVEVTRALGEESRIEDKIDNYIASSSTSSNNLSQQVDKLKDDLSDHIKDFDNPHKVTKELIGLSEVDNTSDLNKPISIETLKELNEINIKLSQKSDSSDLNEHLRDNTNPHNVTKEQVGLSNVDNTSDINKPISLATQIALDKKSDVGHKHVMSDIEDLENLPIVKGFIEVLSELPEDPKGGDKYIMATKVGSGNTRYTLLEYDGSFGNWNLKLLTTGTIACDIDKDVWKLNSSGRERILDVSDYLYFYNKIYDETKDLIEDIDWEENDATNDTNLLIRLKITYKTKYGDPNESEATNPYEAKAVKYIDIDKARFLANAYSRPATLEDVDNGYAVNVGEPLLILVMTTGDHITISLKDALNIYDPIDTASIDMSVSDWTGIPSTSYKISSDVRIAETTDKEDAVSLHILNSTEKGMYALIHTSNTNSISLNPSTGANGTLKTLTANLNINNSLNNNSDVLLTIDPSGLSAKFIWGEYD